MAGQTVTGLSPQTLPDDLRDALDRIHRHFSAH
jgi:hypothetical protein